MTLEEFNKIPNGKCFATGILPNSPEGIYMTNDHFGERLKWIAKKGHGHDWAIYCHWFYHSDDYIETQGQKVTSKDNIQKCVPCEEGVINLYRF